MGIELMGICDICGTALTAEDVHLPGKWMTKTEFIEALRDKGWSVGKAVLCDACCGV